jgi:phosphopantetheinyl transferase (holo-ACP synthase)
VGDNGLLGRLEVLPIDNVLRSSTAPRFIVDPFLLDAAGQLVGYWPVEYLSEGFVLFPIRIQELTLYRENLVPGQRAECRLRIEDISKRRLRANMDILAPDGSLWMRITGWEDWRFYWDETFYNFWRYPNRGMVSRRVELPLPERGEFECRKMTPFGEMGSSIWENLLAHLIMGRDELEQYRRLGDGPRRTEWIFGRAAAKDAVRAWIKRRHGLELYPAEVAITTDPNGKPAAGGHWVAHVGEAPQISIAHKGSTAVAVAGPVPLGIDLETVTEHEEGFERLAFTDGERALIAAMNGSTARAEWITRAWCAKEAAGKAAGNGLAAGPKTYEVRSLDAMSGEIIVGPGGVAGERSDAAREFAVKSFRDGDFVIAVALSERSSGAVV